MISPEIWRDPKFVSLSDDTTRLLFIGLFSNANDYGKLRGEWWNVRSEVFVKSEISENRIKIILEELERKKLILRYLVNGEKYIKLTSWEKHQKVQHPSPDNLPEPTGEIPAESVNYPLIETGRYYGSNWQEQKKKARTRDNFTCVKCGKTTKEHKRSLDVHHVKSFSSFTSLDEDGDQIIDWQKANTLDNLITICRQCHNKVNEIREPFTSQTRAIHDQGSRREVSLDKVSLDKVSEEYKKGNPPELDKYGERDSPEPKNIQSHIEKLKSQFPLEIQELINEYIELARLENKTQKITVHKQKRLINELYLLWLECNQDDIEDNTLRNDFKLALQTAVDNEAPNINYVKKVKAGFPRKRKVRLKKANKTWK